MEATKLAPSFKLAPLPSIPSPIPPPNTSVPESTATASLALPPNLVNGTRDEALDIRPVSEDLRERVAE